jgi:hypothetical protein
MKKNMKQNKLSLLDWWLSIDFDPLQTPHVSRDLPSPPAEQVIELKRGE